MWTFTDDRDDWSYEDFQTRDEAITEAKIKFDGRFFIAQLVDKGCIQWVENIEEIDQ
jgi:hypothetical protein